MKKSKKALYSFILQSQIVFCYLGSLQSIASDFHSPRSDGLGGAGHASPLLQDSIYLNPSFAPYIQAHSISASYLMFYQKSNPTPRGAQWNVSVVDGTKEALFQAGIGYTRRNDHALLHIIAAKQITPRFSLGVGVKTLFPNGPPTPEKMEATLSATFLFSSWLQLAWIGDNLIGSATQVGLYRELILGTRIDIMHIVIVYLDPHCLIEPPREAHLKNSLFGYQAGAEFPFFSDLFFRIGGFQNSNIPYQNCRGNGYGMGLGWLAPKIAFEYGFSRTVSPSPGISNQVGISMFF